jgi:periplasmic protein TonB
VNAVAERASDRAEAVRWVICFAIVAAAHGVGALALLNDSSEASNFGIDAPVVMLELPESLVTSTAPAQDLPPGPIEEQESDPTPPPKEETKPPEPEAEVAIPIPEPPKQEQPVEEKHMTAPLAANAPRVSVARWQNQLMAHIERFKRYPDKAHGNLGSAKVSFTIDHEGHLLGSRIIQSSGSATLDDEVLHMLERAQPLPRPPDQTPDANMTVIFQMNFLRPR